MDATLEKSKKVPLIRFTGFTDSWEQRQLREISKEVRRSDPNSSAPVMMISASTGFIPQSEKYSTDNAGKSLQKYTLLRKGELAYNHGASKIRAYGSCFNLQIKEARIPFVYHCFSVEGFDPYFISIEANSVSMQKQLRSLVSSGARMDGLLNISYEDFASVNLSLPCIKEQQAVSSFFFLIETTIVLHQRKLDELQRLKKSLLQKMFPSSGECRPLIRFAGFTDSWEQRKIGDISSFSKGEGFSKSDLVNQGVPVILYGQMYVNYQTIIRDVDTFVLPNKAGVVSTGHEVIIPASGETEIDIARASFVEKTGVFLGGDLNILKPNEGVDPAFLAIEISNGGTKKELSAKAQGKTIVHLHKDDIITLKICLPKDDEQKRISWFFDCFDHSIVLHQRELDELQRLKKSLLQKMFI